MTSELDKNGCRGIKLEFNRESKFNKAIYLLVEWIAPKLHKVGVTPNMVTTISLVFCYQAVRLLPQKSWWSIVYYTIYVILDYLDGYMAREYKQSTTFGDYYDHARDSITNAFLFYELCCIPTFSYLNASLILVVLGLTMTSFGYQEHIYNKECDINDNQTVDWTTKLCNKDGGCLGWYDDWLGTGGIFVGVALLMALYISK